MELIMIAGSLTKAVLAMCFLHTWGWGDAAWDDPILHPGEPDDDWHKRRRKFFNLIVVAVFLPGHVYLNIVLLLLIGAGSRQIFRGGVHQADPETFRRWYGNEDQ